jgi:hypothetical protein
MNFKSLKKVESPGPSREAAGVAGMITAIIKVKKTGYRPAGVTMRGEISGTMFTAEFPAEKLVSLENDSGVVSVSVSRKLQSATTNA